MNKLLLSFREQSLQLKTLKTQAKALGCWIKAETGLLLGGDTSLTIADASSSPLSFPPLNIFHAGEVTPEGIVWVLHSFGHAWNAI